MRRARRRVAVRSPLCAAWAPAPAREGGGGGGEAGGCGREGGRARGAHGRRARRAPSALPPAGPASLRAAQLCSSGSASPPLAAGAPRDSLPPALCLAALGALSDPWRPASLLHPSPPLSFLPRPFVVPRSLRPLSDLPQPRHQIPLSQCSIYCFSHVFPSPFCSVSDRPHGLCLSPAPRCLRWAPPFPSQHRLIYPLPAVSVGGTASAPGTPSAAWTRRPTLGVVVCVALRDAWGHALSFSAPLLSAPSSLGVLCAPPPRFSRDDKVCRVPRRLFGPVVVLLGNGIPGKRSGPLAMAPQALGFRRPRPRAAVGALRLGYLRVL